VIAHPAASALGAFLMTLHQAFPIRAAVVQVLEPASERGRAGVQELHQQTMQLLSFQKLPEQVFGAQLCFNVLARLGEGAPVKLEVIEQRLEHHLASLLAGQVPFPSLRLLQAPVMHGSIFGGRTWRLRIRWGWRGRPALAWGGSRRTGITAPVCGSG
jgi:aspartate-semialdehyde dehydrogenase